MNITKLGSELETGDSIHFGHESYAIAGFSLGRPFLGATLGRTALVTSGQRGSRFVTVIDADAYHVELEAEPSRTP